MTRYALVPVEPTEKMIEAGSTAIQAAGFVDKATADGHAAMLSAAPEGWCLALDTSDGGLAYVGRVRSWNSLSVQPYEGNAPTPALSICITALRARREEG